MGGLVLLPDRNVFHVLFRKNIDLAVLEKFERSLGTIAIIKSIETSSREMTTKLNPGVALVWQRFIGARASFMGRLLQWKDIPYFAISKEIETLASSIRRASLSIASGVEREDTELLAASYWIRQHKSLEPIIVSDDRDHLLYLHLLAAYLGLAIGTLSLFETMRLSGADGGIAPYCDYFGIDPPRYSIESAGFGKGLKNELDCWLQTGKVATHPRLGSGEGLAQIDSKA